MSEVTAPQLAQQLAEQLTQQLTLLPDYLSHHLLLSVTALVIGIGISLPLAIAAARIRALRGPVLMVASTIQTIPSLALLALMVPLLGQIGFVPAVIALILYSMLPVIRNTVTGIEGVDPNLIEAGRGLGMTSNQLLFKVQLPMALPVIIAGIRTATVWVVGIATLSTPVGATSLGNYIFSGLQTQNYTAVLVGCSAAAALALILDGLIRALEIAVIRRNSLLIGLSSMIMIAVLTVGLWPVLFTNAQGEEQPHVVIGTKTFTEQYILAQLITDRLQTAGLKARTLPSLGSTVAFDALLAGRIDCYVDYSGTLWANHMKQTDNPGTAAVFKGVVEWLEQTHGIKHVVRLGFENTYALAMRRERARAMGIRGIDDLIAHASQLKLGGDYEFFNRPEWHELGAAYRLTFKKLVTMDSALMYSAVVAGEVDVITAFSTDGRIPAFDLVLLEDTRGAFPPYDAMLLIGAHTTARIPSVVNALTSLQDAIDGNSMRAANRHIDVDGGTIPEAAQLLWHEGLP